MKRPTQIKMKDIDYLLDILDPKFIEIDGVVIFRGHFSLKNYRTHWKSKINSDRDKVEKTLNHIHLDDLTDDVRLQRKLGARIRRIWRRVLSESFPSKRIFVVLAPKRNDNSWLLDMWTKP